MSKNEKTSPFVVEMKDGCTLPDVERAIRKCGLDGYLKQEGGLRVIFDLSGTWYATGRGLAHLVVIADQLRRKENLVEFRVHGPRRAFREPLALWEREEWERWQEVCGPPNPKKDKFFYQALAGSGFLELIHSKGYRIYVASLGGSEAKFDSEAIRHLGYVVGRRKAEPESLYKFFPIVRMTDKNQESLLTDLRGRLERYLSPQSNETIRREKWGDEKIRAYREALSGIVQRLVQNVPQHAYAVGHLMNVPERCSTGIVSLKKDVKGIARDEVLEICVVDGGAGICGTLARYYEHEEGKGATPGAVLRYAFKKGTSRLWLDEESFLDRQNASIGLGLYEVAETLRKLGGFLSVKDGDYAAKYRPWGRTKQYTFRDHKPGFWLPISGAELRLAIPVSERAPEAVPDLWE
jgi:hypothetical protein